MTSGPSLKVDVLIVTALQDELAAVLDFQLDERGREAWADARDESGFPYHLRELRTERGERFCIAAAWAGEMGEGPAAVRAVGLIKELDPGCLAMCGICAGWRDKVFLGDVIVADRVFSYESGKHVAAHDGRDEEFFHDITTYNLEATWKMDAAYFAREFQVAPRLSQPRPRSKGAQTRWLLQVLEEYEQRSGPSPLEHPDRKNECPNWGACILALRKKGLIAETPGELRLTDEGRRTAAEQRLLDPDGLERDPSFQVHVGSIATGSAVREDPQLFGRLSQQVRKVLGAEMEAKAIGLAAEQLGRRRSLIVKAVSDYADHDKDDAYRAFACHASAAFLLEFLRKFLRMEEQPQAGEASPSKPTAFEARGLRDNDRAHDEWLGQVERACALRYPQGTRIHRRPGPPPFGTFLETEVMAGRFVEVFPVVVLSQPCTDELLQAFVQGIHAEYRQRNPAVRSTLVHAGPAAPDELAHKAFVQQVQLFSLGEYQGLFDFSGYLQRQTARLETDPIYPPALYVEQRAQVSVGGQEASPTEDVLTTLRELLNSPHPRFALVLGDFGVGKTFLLHELARRMGEEKSAVVPVLIEMRSLQKHRSLKALIAQHFADADVGRLESDQFIYMLQQGRIALLFDGFDELALRVTYDQVLEHFGTLIEASQGQAKLVVTSRTQHFLKDHDVKRELGERAAVLPGYRLIKLERFNETQVQCFLEKRLGSRAAAAERMVLLQDVKDLLGLSENPRLLSFIAELDAEDLRSARVRSGEITAAKLYELLISRWLEGEHKRVNPLGAPKGLSVEQLRRGATELAVLLWERTERAVDIKDLPAELLAAVKAHGEHPLGDEVIRHQLGSGSLLVRDEEGRFSFIHQSVLEWLVADEAARTVRLDGEPALLHRREMSDLMADFFIDLSAPPLAARWSLLLAAAGPDREIASKNGIRLARRLKTTKIMELRDIALSVGRDFEGRDLRGEDLVGTNLRGANLKRANLSGVTLAKTHLSGAQLSEAKLVRANLEGAVLRDADLTKADLSGARLLGADLRGAKLPEARLRLAKLVGAKVDSLEGADCFGAALPKPDPVQPNLSGPSAVRVMAFQSTGELLATAHADGSIRLWDMELGQLLRILEEPEGAVHSLAFSPDGMVLAAGRAEGKLQLWSVGQGVLLHLLSGSNRNLVSVAFSPDGETVAAGATDASVRLWSTREGKLLKTLAVSRPNLPAVSLMFSPDGEQLSWAFANGTAHRWSRMQPESIETLPQRAQGGLGAVFSPGGQQLAVFSEAGMIRLWTEERKTALEFSHTKLDKALCLGFSADGQLLAVGSANGSVFVLNSRQGKFLHFGQEHADHVRAVAFSPNGQMLASGSVDGSIILWSVSHGTAMRRLEEQTRQVRSIALTADGRRVALISMEDRSRLWDAELGVQVSNSYIHGAEVVNSAISPDGRTLALDTKDGTLLLWDAEHGTLLHTLEGHARDVLSLAFTPDGKLLASGSGDSTICLWDVAQGTCLRTLRGHSGFVQAVAIGANGQLLASGGSYDPVRIWSLERGSVLHRIDTTISSVVFSPDGKLLATGSAHGDVRLWDLNQPREARTGHHQHSHPIRAMAFSPDGQILATGGSDGTVVLWINNQGGFMRTLMGHTNAVLSMAFSPNGRTLVSASKDGSVRFWDVVTGKVLATYVDTADGWFAFRADGRFKSEGSAEGMFWHSVGLCRFAPGELDAYLPGPLRMSADEPFFVRP